MFLSFTLNSDILLSGFGMRLPSSHEDRYSSEDSEVHFVRLCFLFFRHFVKTSISRLSIHIGKPYGYFKKMFKGISGLIVYKVGRDTIFIKIGIHLDFVTHVGYNWMIGPSKN